MTSLPLHLVNALPHFDHLAELSISHNKLWYLEKFPPSVARSLTHLDISHNAFSQLPPHLFSLTALTYLDISHNQFCDPKGRVEPHARVQQTIAIHSRRDFLLYRSGGQHPGCGDVAHVSENAGRLAQQCDHGAR
jgi:hypothetical protein